MNALEDALKIYNLKPEQFFIKPEKLDECIQFSEKNMMLSSELNAGINLEKRLTHTENILGFFSLLIESSSQEIDLSLIKRMCMLLDSFKRTQFLIQLYKHLSAPSWAKVFASQWGACDGCTLYSKQFYAIFAEIDLNLIRQEVESKSDKSPTHTSSEIELFRGTVWAKDANQGLSWTTDLSTAHKFAGTSEELVHGGGMRLRFMHSNPEIIKMIDDLNAEGGVILKTTLPIDQVIIMHNSSESEIIVPKPLHQNQFEIIRL